MTEDPELETLEVRLLLEAIHARYGYDLRDYAAASMQRRVQVAMARTGHASVAELQHHLLRDHALFGRVFDDLTVRVSSFFRDPGFFRAFREQIVPVLRTYPRVKVWCVGCATGEEVYGTAVVLEEERLYDRAQVYGTDVNGRALAFAQEGTYSAADLAEASRAYDAAGGRGAFADHCVAQGERFTVRKALRRNAVFFEHDVVGDHVFGEMHVVMCRNVLIYFGDALRARVLAKIAESLAPHGFLCLGASERLRPVDADRYEPVDATNGIYRLASSTMRSGPA